MPLHAVERSSALGFECLQARPQLGRLLGSNDSDGCDVARLLVLLYLFRRQQLEHGRLLYIATSHRTLYQH
jgi:hypothetical protein